MTHSYGVNATTVSKDVGSSPTFIWKIKSDASNKEVDRGYTSSFIPQDPPRADNDFLFRHYSISVGGRMITV